MKVIDLLNKIANGEIPKKIKIGGKIFEWIVISPSEEGYVNKLSGLNTWLCHDYNVDDIGDLNKEVEIIEAEKKIEKIKIDDECIVDYDDDGKRCLLNTNRKDRNIYVKKINEIIDKLNDIENKNE